MDAIRYNKRERSAIYNSPSLFSAYVGLDADGKGKKMSNIQSVADAGRVYGVIEKNTIAIEVDEYEKTQEIEALLKSEMIAYRKHEIEDMGVRKYVYMMKISQECEFGAREYMSVSHSENVMTSSGIGTVTMYGQGERLPLRIGNREAVVTRWVGKTDRKTGEISEEIGVAPSSLAPADGAPSAREFIKKYGRKANIDNDTAVAVELYRLITDYASDMMWGGVGYARMVKGLNDFIRQVNIKTETPIEAISHTAVREAFNFLNQEDMTDDEMMEIFNDARKSDCYKYKTVGRGEEAHTVVDGIDGRKLITHLLRYSRLKQIDDVVYHYNNGVYEPFIKSMDGSGLYPLAAEIREVCPAIEVSHNQYVAIAKKIQDEISPMEGDDEFRKYTILGNGYLDTTTGEFREGFARSIISMVRVPWNYNPDAYDKYVDRALDDWTGGDKELRKYLLQCIGYCLVQNTEQASIILLWNRSNGAGNGKSTMLEMLRCLLSGSNCTSLNMRQLGERFMTHKINGKMANIGDDVSSGYVDADVAEILKKIATGNNLETDVKNKEAREFKPFAKLWFSFNKAMSFAMDKGLERRFKVIPFGASFIGDDGRSKDPCFIRKITTRNAMEYLLKLAVDGLREVIKERAIIEPLEAQEAKKQFFGNADPCAEFFTDEDICENGDAPESFVGKPIILMWQAFKNWCATTGHENKKKISLQKFTDMIINRYTMNGLPLIDKGGKNTSKSGIKLYDEKGNIIKNVKGEKTIDTWSSVRFVWRDSE